MSNTNTLLRGLEEIGAYMRVHPATVKIYIDKRGLPASRLMRRHGRPVWVTSPSLIDQWILAQDKLRRKEAVTLQDALEA